MSQQMIGFFILQIYFGLVNLLSTVPILLAAMIYFKEFLEYCTESEPQGLQLWQVRFALFLFLQVLICSFVSY